ncbi:Z1 domain-containing protein [Nonomuraea sp. NPDC049784]|uniref:Z1 domain-containing protein n=1 Tax=Nonomuraea sp. NPDC049784 TaxID=3154361 RepID=UPI0033CC1AFD
MPRAVGRLGPLQPGLPAEREELALALRELFGNLFPTSVRDLAGRQGIQASSISRYFNGAVLPSEDFISDLIDEVERRLGRLLTKEAENARRLLYAAQDAQTGTWGHAKRWQKTADKARQQAAMIESENRELLSQNRALRQLLHEQRNIIENIRKRELDHSDNQSLDMLPVTVRELLRAAKERIAYLEYENESLRAAVDNESTSAASPVDHIRTPQWHAMEQDGRSYWRSYANTLATTGWTSAAIANIDVTSSEILSHLASPIAEQPNTRRGDVLHHPQSGHTAAMIGLIAKAIDIGYRLVIVLGGTQNAIRRQLQRRLDDHLPSLPGTSGIIRLTTNEFDYQKLGAAVRSLMFKKERPDLPLNAPENLEAAPVRLIVAKKNAAVLRKLVNDLRSVQNPFEEIPALIIDMEADVPQNGLTVGRHVENMLSILPRAQYVGFTSSPFYTIAREDASGHLKDFFISLPAPEDYRGVQNFYDAESVDPSDRQDFSTSREAAYVRHIEQDAMGLLAAIDMFTLTAAMKIYRASSDHHFDNHTMIVYTSARIDKQDAMRGQVAEVWQRADYNKQPGLDRLRALFHKDVLPVSKARADTAPLPESFNDLLPSIYEALDRIGNEPVMKSVETNDPPQWKIVVAGPRKIDDTVDGGLTVLCLHDSVNVAAITRFINQRFGVPTGYADLIRLYVPWTNGVDLYESLVTFWRAEDEIRSRLNRN